MERLKIKNEKDPLTAAEKAEFNIEEEYIRHQS
jgi:hypothetical protein